MQFLAELCSCKVEYVQLNRVFFMESTEAGCSAQNAAAKPLV